MAGLFSEEIHTIKKSQIFECGMSERKAVGIGEKPCGLQLETQWWGCPSHLELTSNHHVFQMTLGCSLALVWSFLSMTLWLWNRIVHSVPLCKYVTIFWNRIVHSLPLCKHVTCFLKFIRVHRKDFSLSLRGQFGIRYLGNNRIVKNMGTLEDKLSPSHLMRRTRTFRS